jgi:hypothetical protein
MELNQFVYKLRLCVYFVVRTEYYIFDASYNERDWIDLAHDRDRWNAVLNLRDPLNAGNFLSS